MSILYLEQQNRNLFIYYFSLFPGLQGAFNNIISNKNNNKKKERPLEIGKVLAKSARNTIHNIFH